MSNNRIKRLRRDLEGIGFEYDPDASSQRRQVAAYRHANDPDTVLRVSDHMSDSGCTAVWKKAQAIAGLSTSGPTSPATIKERARIRREAERAERDKEARAREARARQVADEQARRDLIELRERQLRDIQGLMQPGYGR